MTVPHRINWLLTQLVNMGVPVVIVCTPQFSRNQRDLTEASGWSAEQFVGRLDHYEKLPDTLSEADLEAVARHWMPHGDSRTIRLLSAYARASDKYLAGIEKLTRRAFYLAAQAGRNAPTFADVKCALEEGVVPSDAALTSALEAARPREARRSATARATRVQPAFTRVAKPTEEPAKPDFLNPSLIGLPSLARDTGSALVAK